MYIPYICMYIRTYICIYKEPALCPGSDQRQAGHTAGYFEALDWRRCREARGGRRCRAYKLHTGVGAYGPYTSRSLVPRSSRDTSHFKELGLVNIISALIQLS